jgi:hypothetical protein
MKISEQSSVPLAYSLIRADGVVRNHTSGMWEAATATPTPDQCVPFVQPAGGTWQSFLVADIPEADGFDLADDARCYGCFRLGGLECHAILDPPQCIASTRKFTWACWFKASIPIYANSTLIGEGAQQSDTPLFQFRHDTANGRVLGFCLRDSAGTICQAAGSIPVDDGGWHHAAVTGDGTNCQLYVDGKLDAAAPFGSLAPLTTGRASFGGLLRSTLTQQWKGSLDDVRAYRRALSADEIRAAATRWLAGPTGNGDISVVIWEVDSTGKPTLIHRVVPLGWVVAGNPRPGGSV